MVQHGQQSNLIKSMSIKYCACLLVQILGQTSKSECEE